jgi:hypothetical protein
MKKVLMVTYSFPPADDVCAQRSSGFAEQMQDYGWEPLVLAGDFRNRPSSGKDEQQYEGEDSKGINIDIVRTSLWNPGRLRTPFRKAAELAMSLLVPDDERLWELFCVRKALRLAKSEGTDLIYTVSPPSSAHLIGLRLKKKYPGIPWVADFCSPEPAGRKSAGFRERYEKKLIAAVMSRADCIIASDAKMADILLADPDISHPAAGICHVPGHNIQQLTEQFEKTCRIIASRKLSNNNNE